MKVEVSISYEIVNVLPIEFKIEMNIRATMLALFVTLAMSNLQSQNSPTIMTINGDAISKSEFEAIYKKNNRDADVTPEALDEYSELFVNFKLKVKEAESLKMDTASKFINELNGYRQQLARPYLIDSELTEQLVKEAYDRLTEEIKASHILIKAAPGDLPADTLAAYKRIQKLKADVEQGRREFGTAAKEMSDDPSAKSNEGMLGYFTSLQMVYPFESAAYNTKVGEVSDIVRTRFGYHILKVHDRRAARGEIKSAHIMLKSSETMSEDKRSEAQEKIRQIHQELKDGTNWEKLVLQFSEDKSTKAKGGELPWFGTGKMVMEFEDAAFSLANDGDYSAPIQTQYGWHIIKRLEKKPVPTYDEKKKELQNRITKDSRAQMSKKSFIERVKKDYGFKENSKHLTKVTALVDSTVFIGNWRPGDISKYKKPMFAIGKKKFRQSDFIKFMRDNQGRTQEKDVTKYVNEKYDIFKEKSITAYEDARLEQKYPEFKALMQEYRDGILLFELTDKKVWSMAIEDTVGLKNYYDKHSEEFKYDERVKGSVYASKNAETAARVRQMVERGMTSDQINSSVNVGSQLNLTIISGAHEKNDEEITKLIPFKAGISDTHMINGQHVFMNVKEVLAPEVKPFDRIKGLVTAAYQNQLEKEWISELRAKYTVDLNKEVLHSIR